MVTLTRKRAIMHMLQVCVDDTENLIVEAEQYRKNHTKNHALLAFNLFVNNYINYLGRLRFFALKKPTKGAAGGGVGGGVVAK